jgi:AraC-like DNA-binding protein
MRTFVAENVTDPRLSPEVLAHTHHISLRLLQSLFSDCGLSPASYIREQRLAHAKALLCRGETVTRSALLSGFSDPGTFTRAFRRRYGSTPSEFVEEGETTRDPGAPQWPGGDGAGTPRMGDFQ